MHCFSLNLVYVFIRIFYLHVCSPLYLLMSIQIYVFIYTCVFESMCAFVFISMQVTLDFFPYWHLQIGVYL